MIAALPLAACNIKLNGVPVYSARVNIERGSNMLELVLEHEDHYRSHLMPADRVMFVISVVSRCEVEFCRDRGIPMQYLAADLAYEWMTRLNPSLPSGYRKRLERIHDS